MRLHYFINKSTTGTHRTLKQCLTGALLVSVCAVQSPWAETASEKSLTKTTSPSNALPAVLMWQLTEKLWQASDKKQVAWSPLSLTSAMTHTAKLTIGKTQQETLAFLSGQSLKPDAVAPQLKRLSTHLHKITRFNPNYELLMADSLWISDRLPLKKGVDLQALGFGESYFRKDFKQAKTLKAMNNWVAKHTKDNIPSILKDLDEHQSLVVLNALYFKGLWHEAFDKQQSQDLPFSITPKKQQSIPFIQDKQRVVNYYQNKTLQSIRLPFKGKNVEYVIVMGVEHRSMNQLLKDLNTSEGQAFLAQQYQVHQGHLAIPKHKVDDSAEFSSLLQKQGLTQIFSSAADFSVLTEAPLQVDSIQHKVHFSLDEQGAEAAAATAVTMTRSAKMPPQSGLNFIVNRPFIGFVVHKQYPSLPLVMTLFSEPAQ